MKDYYNILNLERKASPEEIRQHYRELALEYHPDVSMHEKAHEYFVEINEAFQVLGDTENKAKYDHLYDQYFVQKETDPAEAGRQHETFRKHATQARYEAQQNAKISYQEFLKHAACYFSTGKKADGNPYYFAMHRTTGISGGIGPMGSIKGRAVMIRIPRSKHAMIIHWIGFAVKFSFLAMVIAGFRYGLMPVSGYLPKVLVGMAYISSGGLAVRGLYKLTGVKPKHLHADTYFLVAKYKIKGFVRGFHPVISNTPLGMLMYILRWVL